MTASVKALMGDAIAATDGQLGRVDELLFDDQAWHVSYLIVDAYAPLSGRKVLVSTDAVDRQRTSESAVAVRLTCAEVARAPSADTQMPVSRLYEEAAARYYRGTDRNLVDTERKAEQTHLRSSRELIGYSVHGPDGRLGHVDDLLLEEGGWGITALALDAAPHRTIPRERVQAIDWKTREVRVR